MALSETIARQFQANFMKKHGKKMDNEMAQKAIDSAFKQSACIFRALKEAGYDIVPSGNHPASGHTVTPVVTSKREHRTKESPPQLEKPTSSGTGENAAKKLKKDPAVYNPLNQSGGGNTYDPAAAPASLSSPLPMHDQEIINKTKQFLGQAGDVCLLCQNKQCEPKRCIMLVNVCIKCGGSHHFYQCTAGKIDKGGAIQRGLPRGQFGCRCCYIVTDAALSQDHSYSKCYGKPSALRMENIFLYGYNRTCGSNRPPSFCDYLKIHFASKQAWMKEFVRIVEFSQTDIKRTCTFAERSQM